MLKTLSAGAVPEINEPEAKYISDGSSYAGLWILMTALGFLAGGGVALLDLIMRPTLLNLDDVDRLFGLETIGVMACGAVSIQRCAGAERRKNGEDVYLGALCQSISANCRKKSR